MCVISFFIKSYFSLHFFMIAPFVELRGFPMRTWDLNAKVVHKARPRNGTDVGVQPWSNGRRGISGVWTFTEL